MKIILQIILMHFFLISYLYAIDSAAYSFSKSKTCGGLVNKYGSWIIVELLKITEGSNCNKVFVIGDLNKDNIPEIACSVETGNSGKFSGELFKIDPSKKQIKKIMNHGGLEVGDNYHNGWKILYTIGVQGVHTEYSYEYYFNGSQYYLYSINTSTSDSYTLSNYFIDDIQSLHQKFSDNGNLIYEEKINTTKKEIFLNSSP